MGDAAASARQNPAYQDLLIAWQNEEYSPELLPYKDVEALVTAVENQEKNVEAAMSGDVTDNLFTAPMYQADVARVRYALAAYARARLRKILAHADHVETMSETERAFRDRFLALCAKHHRSAFLQDIPDHFADVGVITKPPALDDFVFTRVNKDVDVNDETLEAGDLYVLPYEKIQAHVDSGECDLV